MIILKTVRDFVGVCRYKYADEYQIGFGKYKGMPLTEVPDSYYEWAERNLTKEDEEYIKKNYGAKKQIRCLKTKPNQTSFDFSEITPESGQMVKP
jgi:hypothetical protein